jgi:hypothetical protein
MAMTFVESYFKIDDRFVPIGEFSGEFPDKDYIDGAIVLRIDGQDILTFEHWDLVDQLWCEISQGLGKLAKGQDADVPFPDQPLRLRFDWLSARCIRVTVGDESYDVDSTTFLSTMKRGAKEFFSRMKELLPEWSDTWDRYEKEADLVVTS